MNGVRHEFLFLFSALAFVMPEPALWGVEIESEKVFSFAQTNVRRCFFALFLVFVFLLPRTFV
jgi:hypothetical protein